MTIDYKKKISPFIGLCRLGQLKGYWLVISFHLLLIATAFEGFSFGLLVPFLKQAAGMGAYEGWRNIPWLGGVLKELHFETISHRMDLLLCIIVAAVIIRQITNYLSQVLYFAATSMFEAKLRMAGYSRILNYGCSFFDNAKKGEIQNTLMRFTQEIAEMMRQIFGLCQNLFFAMVYIIVLVNVSLPLSLTAIVLAPVLYLLLRSLFNTIHRVYKRILQQEQRSHGLSFDVFSNIKLVKAMGRERDESNRFNTQERERTRDNVLAASLYLLIGPLQEILMTIGIAAIIGVSLTYYFKDDPSFLIKLIVSLLLFRRAVGVLNTFFSNYPQMIRRFPFVREYAELTDTSDKAILCWGEKKLDVLSYGIEYRAVSMGYTKQQFVLKDISLFMPAGSFTAVVGVSGTGKTTLVELLPRFYDYQQGEILVDDVPLREYDIESLRGSIGFVSQDTLVLNDSILNNILYAKPDASLADVIDVAEKSRVADFSNNLSDGLNTIIGDKGAKLSGGELQRLSIARVMLRKPKILILDEATSALDSISEKMIQEALDRLAKGCTTIAIAHRLSTIRNADLIIVLDEGKVVEKGTMDQLLSRKGLFSRYWETQQFR